jgi:hypothetical protein
MHHPLEILHRLGAGIREVFAPFKEGAVDAVPCGDPLADPIGFFIEIKSGVRVGDPDRVEGVRVFFLRGVEAVRRLVADAEGSGFS